MKAWRDRVSSAATVVVVALVAGCGSERSAAPPAADSAIPDAAALPDGSGGNASDVTPSGDVAATGGDLAAGEGGTPGDGAAGSGGGPADATPKVAASLALLPDEAHLRAGEIFSFRAKATFNDASSAEVTGLATWTSSDPAIAAVDKIGQASGLKAGTVTIKATYQALEATATLVVRVSLPSAVSVSPAQTTLEPLETAPLQALLVFSDGSSKDASPDVTWTSSNATVATVDALGVVTGKATGTAEITASHMGFSAQAQVTVSTAPLTALHLRPAALSVPVGQTRALVLIGDFADGTSRNLTAKADWSSSKPAVATVGNGAAGGQVAAVGPGTTTITANYLTIDVTAEVTVP